MLASTFSFDALSLEVVVGTSAAAGKVVVASLMLGSSHLIGIGQMA